jgi:hypothetical protein
MQVVERARHHSDEYVHVSTRPYILLGMLLRICGSVVLHSVIVYLGCMVLQESAV